MLQMNFLRLAIMGIVWRHFWTPTDSENHQKSHDDSGNPLLEPAPQGHVGASALRADGL